QGRALRYAPDDRLPRVEIAFRSHLRLKARCLNELVVGDRLVAEEHKARRPQEPPRDSRNDAVAVPGKIDRSYDVPTTARLVHELERESVGNLRQSADRIAHELETTGRLDRVVVGTRRDERDWLTIDHFAPRRGAFGAGCGCCS